MKKKTFEQPEMKVVELEQTDIICTSGGDYNSPDLNPDLNDFNF